VFFSCSQISVHEAWFVQVIIMLISLLVEQVEGLKTPMLSSFHSRRSLRFLRGSGFKHVFCLRQYYIIWAYQRLRIGILLNSTSCFEFYSSLEPHNDWIYATHIIQSPMVLNNWFLGCFFSIVGIGMPDAKVYGLFTGNGPSGTPSTRLVWALRSERLAVLHASPCGTIVGSSGSPCSTHGSWPSRSLHGSYTNFPRTSGKAKGTPCRLCRILLSQSHRSLHYRWELHLSFLHAVNTSPSWTHHNTTLRESNCRQSGFRF